jgi:hypothetical protein
MMGFYARADSNKPIHLDYDAELAGKCTSRSSLAKVEG